MIVEDEDGINVEITGDGVTRRTSSRHSKSLLPKRLAPVDPFDCVSQTIVTEQSEAPLKHNLFDSLEEEGKRYLIEGTRLPPIVLKPTEYYVNLHPSPSEYSSSVNSMCEWRDDTSPPTCCFPAREPSAGTRPAVNTEVVVSKRQSFPLTKETAKERKMKKQLEKAKIRDETIRTLEKQMASLYKLKVSK